MGLFEPDKYRTKDKEERELERIVVVIEGADEKVLKRGAERGRIIGESVNFTRDLANEPGVFMTPTILAERAQEVAKKFGLSIDVLDQKRMEKNSFVNIREIRGQFFLSILCALRASAVNLLS